MHHNLLQILDSKSKKGYYQQEMQTIGEFSESTILYLIR